jgi:pSer/pThr/pTyr-binding forkhead associated (FHA) protein
MAYSLNLNIGGSEEKFTLQEGENHVGSNKDQNLVIAEEGISPKHALIMVEEDGAWIQDLESASGTYVNGEPIKESVWLTDGDEIYFGAKVAASFSGAFEKVIDTKIPKEPKVARTKKKKASRKKEGAKRKLGFWKIVLIGIGALALAFAGLYIAVQTQLINSTDLLNSLYGGSTIEVINLTNETYLVYIAEFDSEENRFSKRFSYNLDEFAARTNTIYPRIYTVEFYASSENDPYFEDDPPVAVCSLDLGRNSPLFFTILPDEILIDPGVEVDTMEELRVTSSSICN